MNLRRQFAILVLTPTLAAPADAHHSPSEVIVALSARLDSDGPAASLLAQRGDEYRAVGEPRSAIADYQAALALVGDYPPALYGLARTNLTLQRHAEAARYAEQAVAGAANSDEAAPFHAILATILERRKQWPQAAVQWRRAMASTRPQVDWYLGEARALAAQGLHDEAKAALERAIERNPSVVLRRARLVALIRCGDASEASRQIETGLAQARWKSSWLLLRAELRMSQDDLQPARRDAEAAIREIQARGRPGSHNAFLVAELKKAEATLEEIQRRTVRAPSDNRD